VEWIPSFQLMNIFNKTEDAIFSCRLCSLRAFLLSVWFKANVYLDEIEKYGQQSF